MQRFLNPLDITAEKLHWNYFSGPYLASPVQVISLISMYCLIFIPLFVGLFIGLPVMLLLLPVDISLPEVFFSPLNVFQTAPRLNSR